ncbi:LysM peptidoglycan-binding domain-containing protein [bacterium]|nr:LysM peptidoglycan-binding domain-containing protein [bacterium]MCB2201623.1 LysM peptidoglycan-binding domain-containing protein [bacterium]
MKDSSKFARPYTLLALLLLISSLGLLGGCGGGQSMASPGIYGSQSPADTVSTDTDKTPPRNETTGPLTYRYGKDDVDHDPGEVPDDDSTVATSQSKQKISHRTATDNAATSRAVGLYGIEIYNEDSAAAVDDDIWRLFDLAEEYYQMGVIANREASWEEAQYYFEKSLRIMANLDVESDSALTPEATKYNTILDNVVADYRVTMRSLGRLEQDVAPSVLVERFGDLERNLSDDSIVVFGNEAPQRITYDLPVVMNERVKKSIVYFQTVAKDAFRKYLSRSKKYRWLFEDVLTEYGLPQDLIYLSLVESGYNPNAYSWARAMGLWQFISSTGRLYGLDRDWWIDERKDPVKSTRAAARFLRDLYEKFGDWELAMAAYNGGPGRVDRTMKRQQTKDFWKLNLKRQTMDYVPLIYAATIIAKDPEKYGFTDIDFEDEIRWDEILIDRCLDLKVVARELGCSFQELKDLNPELLRQYTPPNQKKYALKIPVGHKQKFLAAYDKMPSPKETSWVRHQIRRGETVSTIAARYGVSQYAILAANNLSNRSRIYAGKYLIVPVPLDSQEDGAPKKNRKYEADDAVYTVRAGDTMWDIARAFGTTVAALRRVNYIERGSRIYVGQKLKLPTDASNLSRTPTPRYASRPQETQPTISASDDAGSGVYVVRKGDTIWDIARAHGTTTSAIRTLNGLGRSSRIYPGQKLKVGGSGSGFVVYKVRRGDTLAQIAKQYRTTISRIAAWNGMTDPDNLRVGEEIKILVQ